MTTIRKKINPTCKKKQRKEKKKKRLEDKKARFDLCRHVSCPLCFVRAQAPEAK
jgi:hypothetical protein